MNSTLAFYQLIILIIIGLLLFLLAPRISKKLYQIFSKYGTKEESILHITLMLRITGIIVVLYGSWLVYGLWPLVRFTLFKD